MSPSPKNVSNEACCIKNKERTFLIITIVKDSTEVCVFIKELILTKVVATYPGNSSAIMEKEAVVNAASPRAAKIRTRKEKIIKSVWSLKASRKPNRTVEDPVTNSPVS